MLDVTAPGSALPRLTANSTTFLTSQFVLEILCQCRAGKGSFIESEAIE
jgi:hypothetical protein